MSGPPDDDGEDPADLSPVSAKWARSLQAIREAPVSERRAALRRLADAIRSILHRLVQTSAPLPMIHQAVADLEQLADRFAAHPNASIYEEFAEAANAGEPFAFFDHSPVQGRANPLAPPLEFRMEGDEVIAEAVFGAAYEGPPGCVHGGFVAAAFDELLGSTQSLSGAPGMTARLTVNYRSPTPLHTGLRFVGVLDRVDGRKIYTSGRLYAGEVLCAEAEGLFISVDVGRFAELKAQRGARLAAPAVDTD
mgnify:CR=1 FL=1